jgi:hypothetical protein
VPPDPAPPELVDQASFGEGERGHGNTFAPLQRDQQKPPSRGARLGPGPLQPRKPPTIYPDKQISSWGPFPEQVMGAFEGCRMPILLGPDGLPQKEDI